MLLVSSSYTNTTKKGRRITDHNRNFMMVMMINEDHIFENHAGFLILQSKKFYSCFSNLLY